MVAECSTADFELQPLGRRDDHVGRQRFVAARTRSDAPIAGAFCGVFLRLRNSRRVSPQSRTWSAPPVPNRPNPAPKSAPPHPIAFKAAPNHHPRRNSHGHSLWVETRARNPGRQEKRYAEGVSQQNPGARLKGTHPGKGDCDHPSNPERAHTNPRLHHSTSNRTDAPHTPHRFILLSSARSSSRRPGSPIRSRRPACRTAWPPAASRS